MALRRSSSARSRSSTGRDSQYSTASSGSARRTTENCDRSSRKSSSPSSDAVLITTVYLLLRRLRATMETHAHSLRLPSQLLEARGDGAGAGGHQPDLLAARPVDLDRKSTRLNSSH